MANTPQHQRTRSISTRVSNQQYDKMVDFIGSERVGDYLRRLIFEDLQRHGETWPDYEFVDNDDRRQRRIRGRK